MKRPGDQDRKEPILKKRPSEFKDESKHFKKRDNIDLQNTAQYNQVLLNILVRKLCEISLTPSIYR